jgi:hypothetical protein
MMQSSLSNGENMELPRDNEYTREAVMREMLSVGDSSKKTARH